MQADFLLDYDVVSVERETTLYLMARLLAGPAPNDTDRRTLNLSLVIDRSGSMAGKKIEYTRHAAQMLVQNLSPEDMISVVLYNELVDTLLPPQRIQHKDMISQRISGIKAGGTTNLSSGWLEGCNHELQNLGDESINRVILMSDGLANRGITSPEKLIGLAAQKRESGITTTTMGLGEDFNEDLMMSMADAGGGAFYFIESPEVTPLIFQEELKGLLSVIGQNLTITVDYTDAVTHVRQLNNYPEKHDPGMVMYRLGDVFGEEEKVLMLEIEVPAMQHNGELQIARLLFEYDELADGGSTRRQMELPVVINVTDDDHPAEFPNVEVSRSVLLLKAAHARRSAINLADAGRYEEAASVLRGAADNIRESKLSDDQELVEERTALVNQARDMDQGAAQYKSYSRKTMATQAYFTSQSRHGDTVALRMREQKREQAEGNEAIAKDGDDQSAAGMKSSPPSDQSEAEEAIRTGVMKRSELEERIRQATQANDQPPKFMHWRDQSFALRGNLMRVGRAPQNEIVLDVAGISRFHCQIKFENDQWILEDLGSTNGTHVGGVMISDPYTLHDGDVVYLCDQRVVFTAEELK